MYVCSSINLRAARRVPLSRRKHQKDKSMRRGIIILCQEEPLGEKLFTGAELDSYQLSMRTFSGGEDLARSRV